MKRFARIHNGLVAELLMTEGDIAAMFNPAIVWVDVSSEPDVAEGWRCDGANFMPPPPQPAAPSPPSIAELQERIAVLAAAIDALSTQT